MSEGGREPSIGFQGVTTHGGEGEGSGRGCPRICIVDLGGLTSCKPTHTLMKERLKLSWDSAAEEVDAA